MNKQIKIEATSGRLLDREPFLMAKNETLQAEIVTDIKGIFMVSLKNGTETANIRTTGKFDVPIEVIHSGQLEIVVSLFVGATLARRWLVEPITIIEHTETFEGHLVFDEIIKRLENVDKLTAEVEALTQQLADIVAVVNDIAEIVNDPLN